MDDDDNDDDDDDDRCDPLTEAVLALQQRRVDGEPPADLLDDAVALVRLSREPRFDGCRMQTCASDQLLEVYGDLDASGYAAERESIAATLRDRVAVTTPCFSCLSDTMARGAHAQGRSAEALTILADAAGRSAIPDAYAQTYYNAMTAATTLAIAAEMRATEAAANAVVTLARTAAIVLGWAADLDADVEFLRSAVIEYHREACVYEAIARDEIEEAVEKYEADVRVEEPYGGGPDLELLLVERAPRELWGRLTEVALGALEFARMRGLPRHCCRAVLTLHAWGLMSDDDARRELAERIPLLRSDDLTARARELGLV